MIYDSNNNKSIFPLSSIIIIILSEFVYQIQGGVDSYDDLSLQVIFRKRALELVAILRKMTCNLRHPMGLRHPVTLVNKKMHYE